MYHKSNNHVQTLTQETQQSLLTFAHHARQRQAEIKQKLYNPYQLATQGSDLLALQNEHQEACFQLASLFLNWISQIEDGKVTDVRLMHPSDEDFSSEELKFELMENQIASFYENQLLEKLSQELKFSQSQKIKEEIAEFTDFSDTLESQRSEIKENLAIVFPANINESSELEPIFPELTTTPQADLITASTFSQLQLDEEQIDRDSLIVEQAHEEIKGEDQ